MRNYCPHCCAGKVWIGGGIVDVFDWALYGLIRWKWPSLYAKCSDCNGTGMQRPPLYSYSPHELEVKAVFDEPPRGGLNQMENVFPSVPKGWKCIKTVWSQRQFSNDYDVTVTFSNRQERL